MGGKGEDLQSRVKHWLHEEGYPLEFRTGHAFTEAGFGVHQGEYARMEDGTARELDVCAERNLEFHDTFLRTQQVVECKWSADKPWVVFTSPSTMMTPNACIAQTIASDLGHAAMWCAAGDAAATALSLFAAPSSGGGFGGRKCFKKEGADDFYQAMQAVVGNCVALAKEADHPGRRPRGQAPTYGIILFPVVVIDGQLFAAFHDETTCEVVVEARRHVRVYWRGSAARRAITAVDVVTADALETFCAKRAQDVKLLLRVLDGVIRNVLEVLEHRDLSLLNANRAARGIVGLPPLLRPLVRTKSRKNTLPRNASPR